MPRSVPQKRSSTSQRPGPAPWPAPQRLPGQNEGLKTHHRLPTQRDPLERRVYEACLDWPKLASAPPPPPEQPPDRPRTAYENPPPGWSNQRACEPPPFHQKWVILAMAVWTSAWFSLYVASAWLLRS